MSPSIEHLDTSGTDGMEAFIAKYGADEALDGLNETKTAAPAEPPTPPDDGPSPSEKESEGAELDAATLQALGLDSPSEPSPAGTTTEEGTDQSGIDLESLAKTLGLDATDIALDNGELKLTTKVDGEQAQVSLAELRKGYQLQRHFTRQNEEFLQQKQQWDQARQQQEAQVTQQMQLATQILDGEEKALQAKYTKDWGELRNNDPAEYAAQVAEYNQQLQQIRSRRDGLSAQMQQQQQEQWQKQRDQMLEAQRKGAQIIAQELGWKDQKSFAENSQKLRQYMETSAGFTSEEIAGITDPRPFLVTEKARRYDEIIAKAALARKKVADLHKVPAGGAPKQVRGSRQKIEESMSRLAKTGTVEAAADVFAKLKVI